MFLIINLIEFLFFNKSVLRFYLSADDGFFNFAICMADRRTDF